MKFSAALSWFKQKTRQGSNQNIKQTIAEQNREVLINANNSLKN